MNGTSPTQNSANSPRIIRFASSEEMETAGIDLSHLYCVQKEAIKDFNTILNPLFTDTPSEAFFVPPVMLDEEVTARLLGMKPAALQKRRWRGQDDLPHVKIGKPVRYRLNDVLTYIHHGAIPGHNGNPSTIH